MQTGKAYTQKQWAAAVFLSAVLGWSLPAGYITIVLGPEAFLISAIIGLPIAFVFCWIVVAPILWKLMAHQISWLRATLWGALTSSLIAIVAIGIGRYYGWKQSQTPQIDSTSGVLTAYGWLMLGRNTAIFIALGVAIALIIRAIIGPGKPALRVDVFD